MVMTAGSARGVAAGLRPLVVGADDPPDEGPSAGEDDVAAVEAVAAGDEVTGAAGADAGVAALPQPASATAAAAEAMN